MLKTIKVHHPSLSGPITFSFSAAERKAFRRQQYMPPSEWAPTHMVIPTGKYEHSLLLPEMTPHILDMLDAVAEPYVRECNVAAPSQDNKTTFALTFLAWASVYRPGPTMSVFPTEPMSAENMQERIQIAYKHSPMLQKLLTGQTKDMATHSLRLVHSFHKLAWYGSIPSMQNRTIKYLYEDEIDLAEGKFVEADRRVRTVDDHKIIRTSAVILEHGGMWKILHKETAAVYVWWARCPHCMTLQYMTDERIKFNKEDGRLKIKNGKLARYECISDLCPKRKWDDQDRDAAMLLGEWRHFEGDDLSDPAGFARPGQPIKLHMRENRPESIGFFRQSWQSRFVSLSSVAHDFLKSRDKELSPEDRWIAYSDYLKNHRSFPRKPETKTKPWKVYLGLRDDRPAGLVPSGGVVAGLFAGVDTQGPVNAPGFWVSIYAVGYGMQRDMWLVWHGWADGFAALATRLFDWTYSDIDGNKYYVELAVQDMLGHHTNAVKDFALAYEGLLLPSYGARLQNSGEAFRLKRYENGSRALQVNDQLAKNKLAAKLAVQRDDPGALRLHAEVSEDFCRQLFPWPRDHKGVFQDPPQGVADHAGDCAKLAMVAADYAGTQFRVPFAEDGEDEEFTVVIGG
jgi:terminase, large subunit